MALNRCTANIGDFMDHKKLSKILTDLMPIILSYRFAMHNPQIKKKYENKPILSDRVSVQAEAR